MVFLSAQPAPGVHMFYFDPEVRFTVHRQSLEGFGSLQDLQGTYRVVDLITEDGTTKATCYYEAFDVDYPDGSICVYPRDYLLVKAQTLAAEWQRRHLIHLDADKEYCERSSNGLCDDSVTENMGEGMHEMKGEHTDGLDIPQAEVKRCSILCPLYMDSSHLIKTKEEDLWEQAAVTAFSGSRRLLIHKSLTSDEFRVLIERFDDLELAFRPITGYSSAIDTSFNSDAVPRALFDWPSVPGPTSPPVKRPEGFRGAYEDPGYALHEDCIFTEELLQLVDRRAAARPTASSWTQDVTRYITSFFPIVGRSGSQGSAYDLKQEKAD